MNYDELTKYMRVHGVLIDCPDLNIRQEVTSVLLDLNPLADVHFLSPGYAPDVWPYIGVGIDEWCLYGRPGICKPLSVDQFRDLVYGADQSIELAPASLEDVL